MNERFGAVAQRHAGLAARVLGWRPAEFWAATPAELVASLARPDAEADASVNRLDLKRMMDDDNDRSS